MPHYIASHHALNRLRERFPTLGMLFPAATAAQIADARRRLAQLALRSKPYGVQVGYDLLLRCELSTIWGQVSLVFVASPAHHRRSDMWTITTVLTEEMAAHSALNAQDLLKINGARRRRDRRSAERIRFLARQELYPKVMAA